MPTPLLNLIQQVPTDMQSRAVRRPRRTLVQSLGLALLTAGLSTPTLAQLSGPAQVGGSSRAAGGRPSILIYGDSLSAAYGLRVSSGWATLLQERLERGQFPHRVINRSLSGETTYGGLQRLERILQKERPAIVLLALGANDGLRGLPLSETEKNLAQMMTLARRYGAQVLLVGITIPPNYGPDYAKAFQPIYERLAKQFGAPLLPFMLDGFALSETYFQADRIHPNEKAQPLILNNIWPVLRPLLGARE